MDKHEIKDHKVEKFKQSQDIKTLLEDDRFKFLMDKIEARIKTHEIEIKHATSWDDFLTKRAYYGGLKALRLEIDTIISKGKSHLKK